MRKSVFRRILILLLVYFGIFTILVSLQFARRGSTTRRAGNFVVSGHYRLPDEGEPPLPPNEYLVEGDVHVSFGGMDFDIVKINDGLSICLLGREGSREEVLPERVIIQDNLVRFTFANGIELAFTAQSPGGSPEMRINAVFSEDVSGIELPFKPQRRTGIRYTGNGQFIVSAGKTSYTFGNSPIDNERRVLLIEAGGRQVSYRVVPENQGLTTQDYILPQAETAEAYNEAIKWWRDQNYSLWNRIISTQDNEDLVIALICEAFVRGNYPSAVVAIPQTFLSGSAMTYESSVYLGSLEQASRSLSAGEVEKLSRITRQINEKSLEFLLEPKVFEYLAIRENAYLFNSALELVSTIDPSILALDIIPGIFESYSAWRTFRPGTENPFESLVEQACQVISDLLRKTSDGGWVFVYNEGGDNLQAGSSGTEFNLRLGKAILVYAEAAHDNLWAGIGRSLILSAISTAEETDESPSPELTSAKLYRILCPLDTYPRALEINSSSGGVWAWTAAQAVSGSQQGDILDISVTFPAGETHYLLIRGIRAFSRVQLYEMDFRTDTQFERYDSSGWSYNSQDQTLMVKMKHRSTVENIRIIYREAQRPVVVMPVPPVVEEIPETEPETPAATGGTFDY
jgi:hypothetical protein